MITTLTNTCTLTVNDRVLEVLKSYISSYNTENKTNYTPNDVKSIRVTDIGIAFRLSANYVITVLYEELDKEDDF